MNKQKHKDDRIEKPLTDNDFQAFLQVFDKNDDIHRDMTSNEIATIITNRLIKVSEKKKILL